MKATLSFLTGLSVAGVSVIGVLAFSDSQNSLARNGRWIPTKCELEKPLVGADQFYHGKQALRRNRLDLGAWQGFQEVLYRDPVSPRRISFRFALLEGSYLVFEFSIRPENPEYLGIRLSSDPRFSSSFLEIQSDGRFLKEQPIAPPILESELWHSCGLTFNSGVSSVRVDGEYIGNMTGEFTTPQRIGFRGGYRNVFVDDVVVETRQGRRIKESFQNRKRFWTYVLGTVLTVGMVDILLFAVVRRRLPPRDHALMAVVTFNVVFCFVIEVFWGYFVFVDSKRYPVVGDDLLAKERRYIAGVTQAVSESVADSCRNTGAGVPLILFLGSSQTEGVGVKRKGEEFVSRLQKMLAGNDSLSARCINGGISSQNSGGLLNRYLNDWIDCEPSLVVINLANNDVSPEEFRTGLRRFAEVNLMRGIATLFVTEALSVERFPEGRATQHVMREVAREKHVPLVDMHSHLAACVNDGFLWWDHVHPTSFGHQLIAERLYAPIAKLLGQASVRTDSPSGL